MNGEERRQELVRILKNAASPISGTALAKQLEVSRQVIVQDMALLRANGMEVISTTKGYLISENSECSRVFKVIHTDEEDEEELTMIVDNGGRVEDVFVYHKVYGVIKADLNIKSRRDVSHYIENIRNGNSSPLKKVTNGYHYHTVVAENEEVLDLIQQKLIERGFLAKLQDYEPVDFWKDK